MLCPDPSPGAGSGSRAYLPNHCLRVPLPGARGSRRGRRWSWAESGACQVPSWGRALARAELAVASPLRPCSRQCGRAPGIVDPSAALWGSAWPQIWVLLAWCPRGREAVSAGVMAEWWAEQCVRRPDLQRRLPRAGPLIFIPVDGVTGFSGGLDPGEEQCLGPLLHPQWESQARGQRGLWVHVKGSPGHPRAPAGAPPSVLLGWLTFPGLEPWHSCRTDAGGTPFSGDSLGWGLLWPPAHPGHLLDLFTEPALWPQVSDVTRVGSLVRVRPGCRGGGLRSSVICHERGCTVGSPPPRPAPRDRQEHHGAPQLLPLASWEVPEKLL